MSSPLKFMRIRGESPNNTFGNVRKDSSGHARSHQGWDLQASVGTPIYAVKQGKIVFAIQNEKLGGDYGKQICLVFDHNHQNYYAFYAHLSAINVGVGDEVNEGYLLGFSGKTGNAKSLPAAQDHLHFEIRLYPHLGKGLTGRIDPAEILGLQANACWIGTMQ